MPKFNVNQKIHPHNPCMSLMKKAVRSLKCIASRKQTKDADVMSFAELEDIVS